jgi:2-keto-3-deoxy-L-rhamnonate aldolase RhmA
LSLNTFALIYFTADPYKAEQAFDAGVDTVLVDCENKDKESRQTGFNTEINYNIPDDIIAVRKQCPKGNILCRVNSVETGTFAEEVDAAFNAGANGIVLPMTESKDDIQKALAAIKGRGTLTIMIETESGFQNLESLITENIDSIYVGLNDLSISRGGTQLFTPLIDETIQEVVRKSPVPVGVGGVTDPLQGFPIGSGDIIKEYERLGVRFSVLRRSFEEALKQDSMAKIVERIRNSYEYASERSGKEKQGDNDKFKQIILKLQGENQ